MFEALRRLSSRLRGVPVLGLGDSLLAGGLAVWLGQDAALMVAVAAGGALLVRISLARRITPSFGWALSAAALGLL